MTTRTELYHSLMEAEPDRAYRVTYEDEEGEQHWMPVFADDEHEARDKFEKYTGPRRFGLTEKDLAEMDRQEVIATVEEQIDGSFEQRTAVRINPDITVKSVVKA